MPASKIVHKKNYGERNSIETDKSGGGDSEEVLLERRHRKKGLQRGIVIQIDSVIKCVSRLGWGSW